MEIKLQDFPCFYYTAKHGTKADQLRYYATVSSMLGYSMEEAIQSAEFFSRVTKGRLFSNGPYTAKLLQESLNTSFENTDSVHCGKLASKKRNQLKDIGSKCCSICPLSSTYLNDRMREEFIYLKGVIEHPEWLEEFVLDSSQFNSMQSLSLSNDVTYDILPIASMIHCHFCTVNAIRPEKLAEELCTVVNSYLAMEKITEPPIVNEVPVFVDGVLRQIMNVTQEEVTEPQMHSVWQLINSAYVYLPPRTVLPQTEDNSVDRHKRKMAIPSLDTGTSAEKTSETIPEVKKQTVLHTEQLNILAEQGIQTIDDLRLSNIGASVNTMLGLMNMSAPAIAFEQPVKTEQPEAEKMPTAFSESSESVDSSEIMDSAEQVSDDVSEPVPADELSPPAVTEKGCADVSYEDIVYDTTPMEKIPHDLELLPPDEPATEEYVDSVIDSSSETVSEISEMLPEETSLSAENNDTDSLSEEESAVALSSESESEESSVVEETKEEELITTTELALATCNVCSLCSIGASATYFNNVLRSADAIQYAFFLRCMSRVPEQEQFTAMRNKNGCALCPQKGRNEGCIYPSLSLRDGIKKKKNTHENKVNTHTDNNNTHIQPLFTHDKLNLVHKIGVDFIPYIISCTDSQKSNIIDFISEACNATEIAIECVEMHAVKGLLFYVGGKFYFFDPAYGASGFLKPLLSDATKTRFYSMNPIQVHACLYQMGFKHVRIESVAAIFSTGHNLDVLAPVGIIFAGHMHKAYIDDMYAHIMPYYSLVWNDIYAGLNASGKKIYEYGLRLEYALGKNKDISRISIGHEHNVVGGNYLHYRLTMRHLEDLNVPGCHISVTLNNEGISADVKKKIYEVTAGKLGASTSRVHDYTYLLSLSSESMSYFCCYEDKVFFDEFMSCLRTAFKEIAGGAPDVSVERTYFRF